MYKHAGKYKLDEIDGIVYSTDNYTLYNFYRAIFFGTELGYPNKCKMVNDESKKIDGECTAMATPEAFKRGIEQEIKRKIALKRYQHISKRITDD